MALSTLDVTRENAYSARVSVATPIECEFTPSLLCMYICTPRTTEMEIETHRASSLYHSCYEIKNIVLFCYSFFNRLLIFRTRPLTLWAVNSSWIFFSFRMSRKTRYVFVYFIIFKVYWRCCAHVREKPTVAAVGARCFGPLKSLMWERHWGRSPRGSMMTTRNYNGTERERER